MVNKQFWFIVFMAVTGGGLIYFLNSIGVIEAMRNDNTLDYLYEINMKLPKAPSKKLRTVTEESVQSQMDEILQKEAEAAKKASQIDAIVLDKSKETTAKSRRVLGRMKNNAHIPFN